MHHLRSLIVSFGLFLFMGTAQAHCEIDKQILQSGFILYYQDARNEYHLQLSNIVALNNVVHLGCGSQPILTLTCQFDSRRNTYRFDNSYSSRTCNANQLTVVPGNSVARGACTMHHIGFNFNPNNRFQTKFLQLYRSCYNGNWKTPHFTIHDIIHSSETATRNNNFSPDGLTPAQFAAFSCRGVFNAFERELGAGQPYVTSNQCSIQRGHLVPNNDFSFHMLQKATFKTMNYVAQSQNRNQGSWKIVENWARSLAAQNPTRTLRVCTGTLDVLQLPSTSNVMTQVFLWRDTAPRIPIPQWMYKIVDHKYVFLTYNNQFATSSPNPQNFNICNQVRCPSGLNLGNRPFTFCCDHTHFISQVVPYLTGIC
ncbi:uncharacterized protein [Drosophila bipectinata]|uniref:uncharacterized protein n=1 Tax=Drosophila bipectinata TaxID=42026 RepID=UPI0038B4176C